MNPVDCSFEASALYTVPAADVVFEGGSSDARRPTGIGEWVKRMAEYAIVHSN